MEVCFLESQLRRRRETEGSIGRFVESLIRVGNEKQEGFFHEESTASMIFSKIPGGL